jgi:hypothetical protein
MAKPVIVSLGLELEESPSWLDGKLHFVRSGNDIHIELRRINGRSYLETSVSIEDFNEMVDLLLSP